MPNKKEYHNTDSGKLKVVTPRSLEMPKETKYYPGLSLSSEDLPVIKDWKVGETYKLEVEIKEKSMREDEKKKVHADFDIRKIAVK